jgi:hypothetical protein
LFLCWWWLQGDVCCRFGVAAFEGVGFAVGHGGCGGGFVGSYEGFVGSEGSGCLNVVLVNRERNMLLVMVVVVLVVVVVEVMIVLVVEVVVVLEVMFVWWSWWWLLLLW